MSQNVFILIAAVAWLGTAAAVVSTFSKTIIRLRFAAVVANICGLIVSAVSLSPASFIRNLIILPINLVRLREMRKLVVSVKSASNTDLNVEWLKPFMHPRRFSKGDALFRKGDIAAEAYMLVDGEIELPEVGILLSPGALFGEMAMFTQSRARTASAVCRTDGRLLLITYEQFEQLYFQNPEFGLYLVRLIVKRFQSNLALLKTASNLPGSFEPASPSSASVAEMEQAT